MNLYKKIKALVKPQPKRKTYKATLIWPDGQLLTITRPTFEECFMYIEDTKIKHPNIIAWID